MFIFFGLSGFLITQLLVEEQAFRGTIRLREFFKRRIVRLLPALIVFLAVWILVVWVFLGSAWLTTVPQGGASRSLTLQVALEGVVASLSYFMNWAEIFKMFSGYVPIGHIWSLAVEMQFYLVWAFILVFLIRWGRKSVLWFAVLGSFAASTEAIWLMHLGDSGLRIYMGTDVRAGSLLAGAAAAMIWSRTRTDFSTSKVLKIAALISAIEILWSMYAFADPTFSISQQLAWPLTSIACAVAVIYMVELPHGRGGRWALHPVMQYIGKRSYGLYLWHYVWLTWFRGLGLLGVVMALGLSLLSAEMSWRLIEKPVSDWFRHKREEKKTQLAPDINITFEMAESRPSI
jgi:peptidoglycan/LPS O-acetylase OafA/YrhL